MNYRAPVRDLAFTLEAVAGMPQVAATGECGDIVEVTSPDDNLQAVFEYLVK